MSITFDLVCDECKQKFWAGQSNRLYLREETLGFLKAHHGHTLRFLYDSCEYGEPETYEYQDWVEE